EAVELTAARRLAGAEVDATTGDDVERGDLLGHPGRMTEPGRYRDDSVPEPDVLSRRRAGGEEDLRCRRVGVLVDEVVLHFPHGVEPEAVGQLNLLECLPDDTGLLAVVPWTRALVLVEDAESHRVASHIRRRTVRWWRRHPS